MIIEDGTKQHSNRLEEEDRMVLVHSITDNKELRERGILVDLLHSILETMAEEGERVVVDLIVDRPVDCPVDLPLDLPVDLPLDLPVDLLVDLHNRTINNLEILGIAEIGTTLTNRVDKCLIF